MAVYVFVSSFCS